MNAGVDVLNRQSVLQGSRLARVVGNATLLAWLGYLLISPTIGFQWIENWHNEQRAVQVVLLVFTACAYLVIHFELHRIGARQRWSFPLWLLAFLTIGVISSLRAEFVHAALAEVGLFALLAATSLLVAQVVSADPQRYLRWARLFSLLFCTAYVLGVAVRYLAAFNLGRAIDLDVLILGYANPRFPSALHALLIPLVAAIIAGKSERFELRVLAALVLSLIWAVNIGLGTRAIWLAYALGLPAAAMLLGWQRVARVSVVMGLSALAGVVLYLLLFKAGPAAAGFGDAVAAPTDNLSTMTSRDVLWRLSWQALVSAPLLGIGPMQLAAIDNPVGAHPHNWVLQIAAEWGLTAFLLVIGRVATFAAKTRRSRHLLAPHAVAPLVVLAVVVSYGLVDGILVMPVSQTAVALALGLALGGWLRSDQTIERLKAAYSLTALIVLAGAIFAVAHFWITTLPTQTEEVAMFRKAHGSAWLVPRFWEQGLLQN